MGEKIEYRDGPREENDYQPARKMPVDLRWYLQWLLPHLRSYHDDMSIYFLDFGWTL